MRHALVDLTQNFPVPSGNIVEEALTRRVSSPTFDLRHSAMNPQTRDFYLISMAAELLEMHPQTLRKYERLGLVRPQRRLVSMRVYTDVELDRLRLFKTLVDGAGINLAGVRRLLSIADAARKIQPLIEHRSRRPGKTKDAELDRALAELLELLGMEEAR